VWSIIRLAGLAPYRVEPLSSNVRRLADHLASNIALEIRNMYRGLLLALLFGLTTLTQNRANAADDALLLIRVDGALLGGTDDSRVQGGYYLESFKLQNLTTGELYREYVTGRTTALELSPGVYCLLSVHTAPNAEAEFRYCGEPYFQVVSGKVNNAGYWKYGIGPSGRSSRLVFAVKSPELILKFAKEYNSELLRKYGVSAER